MLLSALLWVMVQAARVVPPLHGEVQPILESETRRRVQSPPLNSEDDRVHNLVGLESTTPMSPHYAGYINVDATNDADIFYWLFEATESAATQPLVIWLQGGPGCSSLVGLFLECGPFRIVNESTVTMNPFGWHKAANILFVDQPVGTGMSRVKYEAFPPSGKAVAAHFYTFLLGFLRRHPEYVDAATNETRPIYLFGESHAGRWIPQFHTHIAAANADHPALHIRIDGVGIGNGWIHPPIQYDYSAFAHGHGLISLAQRHTLQHDYQQCLAAIDAGNLNARACFRNLDNVLGSVGGDTQRLNVFDMRAYVTEMSQYPPQKPLLRLLMNHAPFRASLPTMPSVADLAFDECNAQVYRTLQGEDGVSTLSDVGAMLAAGVRVLVYNGQWDMMCHALGTEALLLQADWPGADAYRRAARVTWRVPGMDPPAGFAQSGGNLTFVVVRDAGHLVPYNAPAAALDMVTRFLKRQSFHDDAQMIAPREASDDGRACNMTLTKGLSSAMWAVGVGVALASAVVGALVAMLCLPRQGASSSSGRKSHASIATDDDEEEVFEYDDEDEDEDPEWGDDDDRDDGEMVELAARHATDTSKKRRVQVHTDAATV
ncbi:Aste57867_4067 [Aphanomyces stellatus]|uniref:Aste57867_4067 protein n=1 Tax=Aphanomyces stellatus TaxID=120398 RepID=A0A485KAV5_9STRA|nr:hypothetical protein As57867_004056 [Aphanomyces stellatus]VFT81201.1 Aste57867_4067 [Aphanomyces stellatus]